MSDVDPTRLTQVLAIHSADWMAMPGVVATGQGENCIHVYFADAVSAQQTQIPDLVEEIPIRKIVSGEFFAQSG